MATATLVSPVEYLAKTWRPDRELVDGELIERNVGEFDHSNLQGAITRWMGNRRHEWNVRVLPEQRVRVSATRFRIPDVCVISREQPVEPVFTRPPLICIEILSKDDTLRGMQDRVDDYLAFGVPNIWILDPAGCRAYVCTKEGFHEPQSRLLEAARTPTRIALGELFADLD